MLREPRLDGYLYWGVLPPPITQTTKGPATDGCGPCEPPGCDARRTRTQCEGVQNQIEPYGMGWEYGGRMGFGFSDRLSDYCMMNCVKAESDLDEHDGTWR